MLKFIRVPFVHLKQTFRQMLKNAVCHTTGCGHRTFFLNGKKDYVGICQPSLQFIKNADRPGDAADTRIPAVRRLSAAHHSLSAMPRR